MDASRNDCSSCCWGAELKSSLESLRLHQRIITWTESSVALSPDKSLLKTSKPLPWLPKTHRTETDRTIWLTELWATARHRPHPQARRNQGIPSASVMQRRSNCLRQDPHYPYKYNVRRAHKCSKHGISRTAGDENSYGVCSRCQPPLMTWLGR